MFRLQENVPEIYVNQSRDFQLFCRIYDIINNTLRYNAKSVDNLLNPLKVNDNMLQLLATRVGFFPKSEYNTETLRQVISAFPYMVKYKGSKQGIEMAINVILKAENNYSNSFIYIDNNNSQITIYTEKKIKNENLLRDVLTYILPIGYDLIIGTYTKPKDKTTSQLYISDSLEQAYRDASSISKIMSAQEIIDLANSQESKVVKQGIGSYTTTQVLNGDTLRGENNE